MALVIPKPLLILDYTHFFGEDPPADRISLIKHISRKSILYEISALNYRLRPKNKIYIDKSLKTQAKELKYFAQTDALFKQYVRIPELLTRSKKDYPIIFNRQACLFAIEEIINSNDMEDIDDFRMNDISIWQSIIRYLLAVNYAITQISENDERIDGFESLNPELLPLNELTIETDQLFTIYRGYKLIDYFLNLPLLGKEIEVYFRSIYDVDPHQFIYYLLEMYMVQSSDNPEFHFFYYVSEGHQRLYDKLSERINSQETYKLISIRKSPFIKVGELKYLLTDNLLLAEKCYSQFLNDFWFDWLKPLHDEDGKAKFRIDQYRSAFGYFFEKYLSEILLKCFESYKHSKLLMFDQLKASTPKGEIEIADIYFRYGKKILLGQVKSGSIYDLEKFSGNVDQFYKNDRNAFFKNFGIDQLIESILKMDTYIQILDPKFPKGHSYEIFPCIIVNDKVFQTPLMPYVFNKRFKELVNDVSIRKVKINELNLIHIGDWERLEDTLKKSPKEIWEFLKFNVRDKRFVLPFYNTINYKIKRKAPVRILDLFKSLADKYSSYDLISKDNKN